MKHFPVAILALSLAACSGGRADGELDPGQWKQTATIKSIEVPGAPEQVQKSLQGMAGKANSSESCMTPAQAKVGVKSLASQMQQGDCKTDGFQSAGGKLSGKIVCTVSGKEMVMNVSGAYEPTKIVMKADMETSHPAAPQGKAVIHMDMVAERTGDCAK
ncbi:MAG: DUF3617 domain-containing protein [Novosphingobium sp.]